MAAVVMCVTCRTQPVHPTWRPFCSQRCKMTDLSRWLNGDYRVPDDPAETGEPGPPGLEDEPPE